MIYFLAHKEAAATTPEQQANTSKHSRSPNATECHNSELFLIYLEDVHRF